MQKKYSNLFVGPLNDLGLGDGLAVGAELGQEGEGVSAHQLPHEGQREHLVTLLEVRACENVLNSILLKYSL